MNARSYKDIFSRFEELCPELVKKAEGWRGVSFRHHCIGVKMKDGSDLLFIYVDDTNWFLLRAGNEEKNAAKLVQYVCGYLCSYSRGIERKSRTNRRKKLKDYLE